MDKSLRCVTLRLGNGKYWVAETKNPGEYISRILAGECSKWVTANGFIDIESDVASNSSREILLELMRVHGKENVRGTICPRETISKAFAVKLGIHVAASGPKLVTLSITGNKYYVLFGLEGETVPSYWVSPKDFVEVLSRTKASSPLDHDNLVEALMFEHGIQNVRGGNYDSLVLEKDQINYLETKFENARRRYSM